MTDKLIAYLRKRRDSLIIELGGIEEILGIERSITPRRKRVPFQDYETVTEIADGIVSINRDAVIESVETIDGTTWAKLKEL